MGFQIKGVYALGNIGHGQLLFVKASNNEGGTEPSAGRSVGLMAHQIRRQGPNMSKVLQIGFFAVVATVAMVSGLTTLFIAQASDAVAETASNPVHAVYPKGDRVPFPAKGAACSVQEWPHYEQQCLFDHRRSANEVQTVRVIAMR